MTTTCSIYLLLLLMLFWVSTTNSITVPDLPADLGIRTPTYKAFGTGSLILDMGLLQTEDSYNRGTLVSPDLQTLGNVVPCNQSYSTGLNIPISLFTDPAYKCNACQYVNASMPLLFNNYAYGFIARMLEAGIPLYWGIKSNKQSLLGVLDPDIALVTVQRIHPTREIRVQVYLNASESSKFINASLNVNLSAVLNLWPPLLQAVPLSFYGGPILIRAQDAVRAMNLLNQIKSEYTGFGRFESLVIFNYTGALPLIVDVRHKLLTVPKVAVSTVSNNWCNWGSIPLIFMNSGLIQNRHFSLISDPMTLTNLTASSCISTLFEPGLDYDPTIPCSSSNKCYSTPDYIGAVSKFVSSGGNLFAQSSALTSYENAGWPSEYFPPTSAAQQTGALITNYGIQGMGSRDYHWRGQAISGVGTLFYSQPDLPISQFVGVMSGLQSGPVTDFYLRDDPNPGVLENRLWKNNGFGILANPLTGLSGLLASSAPYNVASLLNQGWNPLTNSTVGCDKCCPKNGNANDSACSFPNFLPTGRTAWHAAGGKMLDPSSNPLGGLVWYFGGRSWFTGSTTVLDIASPSGFVEDQLLYNGRRLILNAFIIPAVRPLTCGLGICENCTYSSSVAATTIPSISLPASISISSLPSISLSASPSFGASISISALPTVSISTTRSMSILPSISVSPSTSVLPTTTLSTPPSLSLSSAASHSSSLSITSSNTPSNTRSISFSIAASISPSIAPSISSSVIPTVSTTSTFSTSLSDSISMTLSASTAPSSSTSPSSSNSPSESSSLSNSESGSPAARRCTPAPADETTYNKVTSVDSPSKDGLERYIPLAVALTACICCLLGALLVFILIVLIALLLKAKRSRVLNDFI